MVPLIRTRTSTGTQQRYTLTDIELQETLNGQIVLTQMGTALSQSMVPVRGLGGRSGNGEDTGSGLWWQGLPESQQ